MYEFSDEEIEKLSYLQAKYCLDRFEQYWKETGDFDGALARAFPEVRENECIDSTP